MRGRAVRVDMTRRDVLRLAGAGASLLAIGPALAACGGSTTSSSGGSGTTTALQGSTNFNNANLKKLATAIQQQLQGKDLSQLKIAMVINIPGDYWTPGQNGLMAGAKALGINAIFQAPTGGDLSKQISILETLNAQRYDYSLSAIDPAAARGPVDAAVAAGQNVIAIDSPLTGTKTPLLYLGTPNTDAGKQAGEAVRTVLGGKGDVAILTGSLTAANALQRIAGFKGALGSGINVVQTLNDQGDHAKAESNAETALQANPNLAAMYGVYSYNGPQAAQALKAAGKSGKIKLICDDVESDAVAQFIKSGVIQGTAVQDPYQQGYMTAFVLAAMRVLGKDATTQLLQPYVSTGSDGVTTLSSGVGLVTKDNLDAYNSVLNGAA
jgi:ribose transport system substrate-binding protein